MPRAKPTPKETYLLLDSDGDSVSENLKSVEEAKEAAVKHVEDHYDPDEETEFLIVKVISKVVVAKQFVIKDEETSDC